MAKYAKFISEDCIRYAPRTLKTPSLIAFNFNQNEALMRQEGYYPLTEMEVPTEAEGYYNKPQYQFVEAIENDIDGSYIAVTYTQVPIVAEEE